jgi:hypothetical protein
MARKWWLLAVVILGSTITANGMQGPEVGGVMREKLAHSQKILEALVTSDWVGLEAHSLALEKLTEDRRWRVFNYPEYARHSAAFKQAAHDLHTAAVERDLEQAPKAYIAVTMRCIECHRYLARERLAGPAPRFE